MSALKWIKQMLDERGIPYGETSHPAVFTAQGLAQKEHCSGHRVAKAVAVSADGNPIMLVLPASRKVQLERVAKILGAKEVQLVKEKDLAILFADCEMGAMPPLRHWKDVDILMDSTMKVLGDILFEAGTHTDGIHMRFADWVRLVKPRVESFSEGLSPAPSLSLPAREA